MLYLLVWLIILAGAVYFFKKSAGSLSPLKLNLNSIIFYYSFLISSYLGTLLIAMGIDDYYMINRLTHPEVRWIGFYAISFVMLFFPLVMFLLSKIVGFDSKKELNAYLEKEIELPFSQKNEFFQLFLLISLISLAAIAYTLLKTKHIPILELVLRSTDMSPGALRIDAQRNFAGNVLIRNIFALALTPILSLIAYVYSVKTNQVKWKILFLTLFAGSIVINVYDLAKSPIFFYIIMFLLLRMYMGKFHFTWRRITTWGIAGALLLVGMYIVIQGVTSLESYLSYNSGPIGRIIFAQIAPTFLHLDTFPQSIPFLNGRSLPASFINLFDMEQVRSARLVMARVFPEKIQEGTAGVLNTLFIAEAYANYGYIGIIAGTTYVAVLVQSMYIAFLRLPKNPVFLCLFVYFTIILLLSIFPLQPKAAELITYPNKVNVSVYTSSSLTLKLNNVYQLKDNQSGMITTIPPNTTITVKNTGTNIEVSYTGMTLTSSLGFDVQESTDSTTSTTSIGALSNGISYRGSFTLKKNGSNVEVINYLGMEDYLKGVVPSEMPASWPKEALKAQAIAARSYAATSMGLSSTPSSQVYRGYTGEDSRSNAAIKETEGLMAKFAGATVMTYFFSTSGGQTANYGDVWNSYGKEYPYYSSVEDPYENSPYSNWTETFPAAAVLKAFGYTNNSTKLLDITLAKTGANGEVSGVTIKTSSGDKTIEGNESTIRKLFSVNDPSHYNQLNSNWFTATLSRDMPVLTVQTTNGTQSISALKGQVVQTSSGQITLDDSNVSIQTSTGIVSSSNSAGEINSVTLNGKGWGHRIGMSQYGAKGMAEHGWTANQIIQHYFRGTTVSK